MHKSDIVIVAGMGEVGRPLSTILSRRYSCVGIDIAPVEVEQPCDVLHICYPFQIPRFIHTTIAYIEKYHPRLVIINSTVAPGTTRVVQEGALKALVAYSPVRGKHARMVDDMLCYKKFVAGCVPKATQQATEHFERAGLRTHAMRTPEIAELSKLLETSYLGLLVAWAQEVERLAARCDASFDEVNAFVEEVDFLPSHIFPGVIGGHCVMPNIDILRTTIHSQFLEAVVSSNELKHSETARAAA